MSNKQLFSKYLTIISGLIICFAFISCKTTSEETFFPPEFSIIQKEKVTVIKNNQSEYTIRKEKFTLRFLEKTNQENPSEKAILYAPYYADNFFDFKTDAELFSLNLFKNDNFIIPEEWAVNTIFISDDSYHIISEESFFLQSSKLNSDFQYLEWEIRQMDRNGTLYKIEDFPWEGIYLVFYKDINGDGVVDKDELYKIILRFE